MLYREGDFFPRVPDVTLKCVFAGSLNQGVWVLPQETSHSSVSE
jgi:hypothetical protein